MAGTSGGQNTRSRASKSEASVGRSVGSSVEKAPTMMATIRNPDEQNADRDVDPRDDLGRRHHPRPVEPSVEAAIAFEALTAKTRATMARTNGHTAHERIARTSATMASDEVCGWGCGCP